MKKHRAMRIDPVFVRKVNLAYHEEEAARFASTHPEIFTEERERWSRIASIIKDEKARLGRGIVILDVGTGTGFVPKALVPTLESGDALMLTDLSPSMIETAKKGLVDVVPSIEYRVLPAEELKCLNRSFDIIVMNSVLHHIPETKAFLDDVDGLLRAGGLLIIAHEPNIRHFRSIPGFFDRCLYLLRGLRYPRSAHGSPFTDGVNRRLMRDGIVHVALSTEDLEGIVDIHSPTGGRRIRVHRGFDPLHLDPAGKAYRREWIETYRHFGKVQSAIERRCPSCVSFFRRMWPNDGALFSVILRKP